MPDYWPTGVSLDDTQPPTHILEEAQENWTTRSKGVLVLLFQSSKTTDGNEMTIVHAKHVPSNRTGSLFSIIHRPDNPYPVTIQPDRDGLPNYLRKSYYVPGSSILDPLTLMEKKDGRTVKNEWVAETPADFRERLQRAFNLGSVKSVILNLAASSSVTVQPGGHELPQQSTPDDREQSPSGEEASE